MANNSDTLKHVIDPDQPDAHEFTDKAEIFFQDEFKKALTSICEHVDRLKDVNPRALQTSDQLSSYEKRLIHRHSTIGIFGPRGVGKTSFLLTLKNAFDNKARSGGDLLDSFEIGTDATYAPSQIREKVWTLESIDPSRIENEDKLLVTITSKILDHVRRNNDGDLSNNTAIQDALEDLSRRFRVLFPEAVTEIQKDAAADPLRFAGEVLFDADSGPKLAVSFHRFVALAAQDLGVRCFMLPIDDVDTSFDKGWPLLETLRKYLATDRLITVVSGDLELFDLIVQQKAHERTQTYRKSESSYRSSGISSDQNFNRKFQSIRRFPGQYLLKVFPVNSRVRIPDLHSVLLERHGHLFISRKGSEAQIPLGNAILVMSRLLFGTAYTPGSGDNESATLQLITSRASDPNHTHLAKVSRNAGPNAIDVFIPQNTRRFIALIESIPGFLGDLSNGESDQTVANRIRQQIAENHSSFLQTSGINVEDIAQIARGDRFYQLNRAFKEAKIPSTDLARLQADLFKDLPSYDQWRALLSLVSSALYADWSMTMTGPIRYSTKVWDSLATTDNKDLSLDDIGSGFNEPSWKSRCRLLRAEIAPILDKTGSLPEALGTSMRVPRQQRNSYQKDKTFAKISPSSSISPDYMRWWKAVWDADRRSILGAKNRAVMPESKFVDYADGNANVIYGLFRTAFRSGTGNYRYIDFRRGLGRIDDLVRESIREEGPSDKGKGVSSTRTRLSKLAHDALDFVLLLNGNPSQIPGSSQGGEYVRRAQNFWGLPSAVEEWITLAKQLAKFGGFRFKGSADEGSLLAVPKPNILPSPWTLVDAYDRFLTDADEITNLPWRQQTVGTMLERFTIAFWNALLQKEVLFRIEHGIVPESIITEFDFGPFRDSRRWISKLESSKGSATKIEWSEQNRVLRNAFTRNINAIVDFANNDSQQMSMSLVEVVPYTTFWMCCPFLLPLLSREIHDECVVGDRSAFIDTPSDEAFGFLEAVYASTHHPDKTCDNMTRYFNEYLSNFYSNTYDGEDNRPPWQQSTFRKSDEEDDYMFDIHDILCGIARSDQAPYDLAEEKQDEDSRYLQKLGIVDE